jgi:hypothetical protein
VGTLRRLQQIVDATRTRGRLLEADWDEVAGNRTGVEIALESLRAYVTETINAIDPAAALPKREASIGRIADPKQVAGSLQLILIAEQALHLLEYLRLERIRATEPEHLASAIDDARQGLAGQRERDATLVRAAAERIEAAQRIDPFEIHRVLSIPRLTRTAAEATDVLDRFAEASRADLPDFERVVRRPRLSETRDEARRHALTARDGVVDISTTLGIAAARSAKRASGSVREKVSRRKD